MKLSLVVPCYNEEENVGVFCERAKQILSGIEYEIVFVNDGSKDGTIKKLKELASNNVIVIDFSRNFGKEAGIYAGLQHASGEYVVIIDADLRKPKIHKYTDVSNESGLANYLGGFCELEKCIVSNKKLGLDCITAGSVPPNPTELLSSPLLKEGLEKLAQKYDYIFIDTPPVNVVTDGIIVSKLVDSVLLVARQKYTAHEALKKAFSTLTFAEANVIGFIMNDAEEQSQKYKYKYKYRYRRRYYAYGYGKYYKYYKYKVSDYKGYK